MVRATDLRKEEVYSVEIEIYHAVEYNGERFRLHEPVTISTSDHAQFSGKILDISETSLDFMTKDNHFKIIKLSDITSIHY